MTDTTDTDTDNVVPENEFARRRAINENVQACTDAVRALAFHYLNFRELGVPTSEWLPQVIDRLPEPYRTTFAAGAARSGSMMVDLIATFAEGGALAAAERLPEFISRVLGGEGEPSLFAKLGARAGMAISGLGLPSVLPTVPLPPGLATTEDERFPETDSGVTAARMRVRIGKLLAEAPVLTLPDGTPDPSQTPALECALVLRGSIPPIQGVLSTTEEGGLRFMTPTKNSDGKPVLLEQFFDYADVIAVCVEREVKATRSSLIHTS